jgi:hypothetical protein
LRPWPNVLLALGLLLEKPSVSSIFPSQPFEIIASGFSAFGLFASWMILIVTLTQVRGATSTDDRGRDVWSWLFQDRIRWQPRWWNLRWDVTGTAIGVGFMAFLTGRFEVGVLWTLALVSLFVVEWLFDRMVRGELARLTAEWAASTTPA